MKVSLTTHRSKLGLLPPDDYKQPLFELYEKAEKKHGGYVTISIELPKKPGSEEQNRAWHALIGEYWKSGCSSYDCYEDMRDSLKLRIAGAKEYIWLDEDGMQHTTTRVDDIPQGSYYVAIPKSWTDFTKGDRKEMIDMTIDEMIASGVNSRKFDEIIQGMEGESCH